MFNSVKTPVRYKYAKCWNFYIIDGYNIPMGTISIDDEGRILCIMFDNSVNDIGYAEKWIIETIGKVKELKVNGLFNANKLEMPVSNNILINSIMQECGFEINDDSDGVKKWVLMI